MKVAAWWTALWLQGIGVSGAWASDMVARVADTQVTADELRGWFDTLGPTDKAAVAKDPALLSQLVRAYLARRLVLTEALTQKWEQRPEVKTQLERAREQALIDLYLQSASRPPEAYPSEAELQAAYQGNPTASEIARQFRLAQIFIAAKKGTEGQADEKARQRLDDVAKKLKVKGADFAAIATTDSDEAGAPGRSTDLGWLTEAQLVPAIRPTVTTLKVGAISEPIRLDDGWHLLKLLETKPPSVRPFAEVKDMLKAQLREDHALVTRQAYLARLLEL